MTCGNGWGVAIAGRADAAGIDDQAAVTKSYRARHMGVAAEDKRLRDAVGQLLDRFERGHPHRAIGQHILKPIDLVTRGRGVAEKHLVAV